TFCFINCSLTGKILAGIEACGRCNFWARKIKALGHDCKVMPAFQIKAFLSLDTKTDKVDALAILRAVMSVSIK
ncbi:transposase, partial [Vibrio cholerae O1]|nr:transposase [Vibrio cholerae O1]